MKGDTRTLTPPPPQWRHYQEGRRARDREGHALEQRAWQLAGHARSSPPVRPSLPLSVSTLTSQSSHRFPLHTDPDPAAPRSLTDYPSHTQGLCICTHTAQHITSHLARRTPDRQTLDVEGRHLEHTAMRTHLGAGARMFLLVLSLLVWALPALGGDPGVEITKFKSLPTKLFYFEDSEVSDRAEGWS